MKSQVLRLPPCGGSGLKWYESYGTNYRNQSPSMRREWIEILYLTFNSTQNTSPSMRREWIEIDTYKLIVLRCDLSPSMRREWIEIFLGFGLFPNLCVSLHAEGVD